MEHNHSRDLRPGHDRPLELLMGSTGGHSLHRVPLPVCYGPEMTGKALDDWAYRRGVRLNFIEPGKPVQNAFAESRRTLTLNDQFWVSVR